MNKSIFTTVLAVILFVTAASAQKAEVTISLNEPFFDALLDSVYLHYDAPEFSIAQTEIYPRDTETQSRTTTGILPGIFAFAGNAMSSVAANENSFCSESVKILRESNGVRTAVRFRDGKVYVPLAFTGGYPVPLIGCVDFAGTAEANVDLEFDQATQRLIGRAHVTTVNLNGTAGVGGTLVARLIQGSIDKKLNPIEILSLDKISFGLPIPNTGTIKMKATGVRPEILNGSVQIRITYDFLKG